MHVCMYECMYVCARGKCPSMMSVTRTCCICNMLLERQARVPSPKQNLPIINRLHDLRHECVHMHMHVLGESVGDVPVSHV